MDEAQRICRSIPGGRLVSIHDSEENDFVASLVTTGDDAWTGGLLVDETWVWGDGTAWEFDSWRGDADEECGFLKINSDGMWFGEENETSLSGFVCKHNPARLPLLTTTISTSTSSTSTTTSLNDMLCEGYLCSYDHTQLEEGVVTCADCKDACLEDEYCEFFTFTNFRGKPHCYLLQDCTILLNPARGCASGPRNCAF